jgi:hypothetical protein
MGRIRSRLQSDRETLGLIVLHDAYSTTLITSIPSVFRTVTPISSKRRASLTIFSNLAPHSTSGARNTSTK